MRCAIARARSIFALAAFCLAWQAFAPVALAQQATNLREKGVTEDHPESLMLQQWREMELQARYVQALVDRIRGNWKRPDRIAGRAVCRLKVRQNPGGNVISAEVLPDCPYDDAARRSIEAAVLRSQPLPYEGFESVFSRILILDFRAQ